MRLLQRYILGELLRVFLVVLFLLTVLLVFVGAFGQANDTGLGPAEILPLIPYLVPSLLPFTIPATMLLTVTVVYGRIAADHEVTAVKAAGISAMSVLWPSFVMSSFLSIASLVLADQVVPWAMANVERRVALMAEQIFLDVLRARRLYIHQEPPLTVSVLDVEGNRLINPVFQYTPKGSPPITMVADEAQIVFDLEKGVVRVKLRNGRGEIPNRQNFRSEHFEYPFPLPQVSKRMAARYFSIHNLRKKLDQLTAKLEQHRLERDLETAFALGTGDFDRIDDPELLQFEVDLAVNKEEMVRDRTEIHQRFALSASCFFFALVGGPFSILQARRQVLTSFFCCFLPILVVYYPIVLSMTDLSKSDEVNPVWAMWLANALLLPVGLYTLRRVLKH
jgi:lipopolysaccharide export system permease protein